MRDTKMRAVAARIGAAAVLGLTVLALLIVPAYSAAQYGDNSYGSNGGYNQTYRELNQSINDAQEEQDNQSMYIMASCLLRF